MPPQDHGNVLNGAKFNLDDGFVMEIVRNSLWWWYMLLPVSRNLEMPVASQIAIDFI